MSPRLEAILKTLVYYDAFDFPLTAQEVFLSLSHYAFSSNCTKTRKSLDDVLETLASPEAAGSIGQKDGLYFLRGRSAIVETRHRRYVLAEKKYRRALRFFGIARHAPFLRAAFVCNTLGRSNARDESDIDLFLIVEPKRLWLARLCVTGLAAALRLRPTETVTKDRLCLSFFVSADSLDLEPMAIADDIYLAHWLQELTPIYDEGGMAEKIAEANAWIRRRLPNAVASATVPRRRVAPAGGFKRLIERLLNALGADRIEAWAKRLQMKVLPQNLKAQAASGNAVVLSDSVLKFHDQDRRAEIRDRYKDALERLFVIPTEEVTTSGGTPLEENFSQSGSSTPPYVVARNDVRGNSDVRTGTYAS